MASPAEAVRDLHLGGVIYFAWSRNTRSPAQIAELSAGLHSAGGGSLMIGIDQEVGGVDRIGPALTPLPSQWALGGSGDPALTAEAYLITARELRALGITTDYAPVADVNVNPDNPVIGIRAFGADPTIVAEHTAVAVRVLQYGGISAVAKHFPGHGDTSVDSHLSLPVITHSPAQWEHLDAPPFRAAIEAGVDGVMTGHLAFPELDPTGAPATLSAPLIALLRDLGFEGVIHQRLTADGGRTRRRRFRGGDPDPRGRRRRDPRPALARAGDRRGGRGDPQRPALPGADRGSRYAGCRR